jgi:hypothetical protein
MINYSIAWGPVCEASHRVQIRTEAKEAQQAGPDGLIQRTAGRTRVILDMEWP